MNSSPRKFTVTAWSSDGKRAVAIKGPLNPSALVDEEDVSQATPRGSCALHFRPQSA
jgi:hypothetical protein